MHTESAPISLNCDLASAGNQVNQDVAGPSGMNNNNDAYDPIFSSGSPANNSEPSWLGWFNGMDRPIASNQSGNSRAKDEQKTSNALLDARLKVIEARLKINAGNLEEVKIEVNQEARLPIDPNEVIEVSDDEGDDTFNPPTTSTRIKEEFEKTE